MTIDDDTTNGVGSNNVTTTTDNTNESTFHQLLSKNDKSKLKKDVDKCCHVIVVRHGERLDYSMRDYDNENWCIGQDHPWDPPLTEHGMEQATELGKHISSTILEQQQQQNGGSSSKHNLPPVSAIYTSPFLRCRQTSIHLRHGLLSSSSTTEELQDVLAFPKIQYDWGLAESLNESWFRSWSLPGSDGTWGYGQKNESIDLQTLHPAAKLPVQESVIPIMEQEIQKSKDSITTTTTSNNNIKSNENSNNYMNCIDNASSRSTITEPYCFATGRTESAQEQRRRMMQTLEQLVVPSTSPSTIILVSHGGPVTHLYEALTGNPWYQHGESTYCCYSIYKRTPITKEQQPANTAITTNNIFTNKECRWEPVLVNESSYLQGEEILRSINYMDGN